MAIELRPKGIAAVVLYPGSVATEFIQEWSGRRGTDLSGAQTTLGVGRTAAALATLPDVMERSGTIQWCEDLSRELDVRDEHGNHLPAYAKRVR